MGKKEVLHLFRWFTLAQKYLIELLMWNASHVQKTLQLNLTGTVERLEVRNSAKGNLSTSLLEGFTSSDAAQSDCEKRTGADVKQNGLVLV